MFNPKVTANLETKWWIAHNEKDKEELMRLLPLWISSLYTITLEQSNDALVPLLSAVKYHDSREWEKAIENITIYYEKIKKYSGLHFDPAEVGKNEIGWWELHDNLEFEKDKSPLAQAFANYYGSIYKIDPLKLTEVGMLKAQATYEHDLAEDPNTNLQQVPYHWQNVQKLLTQSYEMLQSLIK